MYMAKQGVGVRPTEIQEYIDTTMKFKELQKLVSNMISQTPEKRPNADGVLQQLKQIQGQLN